MAAIKSALLAKLDPTDLIVTIKVSRFKLITAFLNEVQPAAVEVL